MLSSKLITLLKTFTKDELKSLGDYVQSPFFNKREAPISLYKVLLPLYPTFEALKWEKVFKKSFPEKMEYSESYLRNVLSDLYQLAEAFLGQQLIQFYDAPLFIGHTVSYLLEKRLYKSAEDNLNRMSEALSRDDRTFHDYSGTNIYYHLLKMRCHDRQEQRQEFSQTQQLLANALVQQCTYRLLRRYYEMSNDKEVFYQYDYEFDFFERFTAMLQHNDIDSAPDLAIAYYKLQLQTQKTWPVWQALYDYLQQHKSDITDEYIHVTNLALINFIAHQKRLQSKLTNEILIAELGLYEETIAIRLRNNFHVTGFLFTNIVSLGASLKGNTWARQFMSTHSQYLPPNLRSGLEAYSAALLFFSEGNYIETIAILANIEPFYSDYYFLVKSLTLMAYYELDNYDAFMATLDTLKKTIANHPELAQKAQISYANTNTILLKLYRLRLKRNPKTAKEIQQLLESPDLPVYSKQWAVQKLAELNIQDT